MAISSIVSPSVPGSNLALPSALDNLSPNTTQNPNASGTPELKGRPRDGLTGQNNIGATPQSNVVLMAVKPAVTLAKQRVQQWNRAIIPAVETYKPGAPILRPKPLTPGSSAAIPGRPVLVPSPRITVPKASESTAPTSAFFGVGAPVVSAPGVPALQGQPTPSILRVVNEALPNSKVAAFAALNQPQKLIARTMLAAAIQSMSLDRSNPDYVDPKYFKGMVSVILQNAQAYAGPTVNVPAPAPVVTPAPQKKAPIPDLPRDPVVVSDLPKDPITPAKGKKPQTQSTGAPSTESTAPLAEPPEIPGLTLRREDYNELIKGPNGKVDPVRKDNIDNLLGLATEFRAQIDTINVDKVVNPNRSTKTPREEWFDWKRA
jgi:hypothetical protein